MNCRHHSVLRPRSSAAYAGPRLVKLSSRLCFLVPVTLVNCASLGPDTEKAPETNAVVMHVRFENDGCLEASFRQLRTGRLATFVFELFADTEQELVIPRLFAGDLEFTGVVTDGFSTGAATCPGNATHEADALRVRVAPGRTTTIRPRFGLVGRAVIDPIVEEESDVYDDAGAACPVESLTDDFSGAGLGPAWSVWEYTGPRSGGQSGPAGLFEVQDGRLVYTVTPMTRQANYTEYVPWFDGSFYTYDPGAVVSLEIEGTRYATGARVEWYAPVIVNAATMPISLHIGPPGDSAGWSCDVTRYRNDSTGVDAGNVNNNQLGISCENGTSTVLLGPPGETLVRDVRFERDGDVVSALLREPGADWQTLAQGTIPAALSGCEQLQRLEVSGGAWFQPEGSNHAYDDVYVEEL